MGVCFQFDARAWDRGEARYAVRVVASVLERPSMLLAPGQPPPDDAALVFVGARGTAPADAAAVIPVEDWPAWDPARVEAHPFEGAPMLALAPADAAADAARDLPVAWLRAIAFLVTREEEVADPRRDQWDCFSGNYTRLKTLGVLERPLVNLYAAQLERRIAAWLDARGRQTARVPRWKNGARMAVVLTHDVDWIRCFSLAEAARLLRRARAPRDYAFRAGLAQAARALGHIGAGGDPFWNFERWVDEEERRGFRSSFYFFASELAAWHEYDATYRLSDTLRFGDRRMTVAEMMRAMAERGFEVGLHGSYLSHVDGAELSRQRRQIEQAVGMAAPGTRQHYLRFDPRRTWAAQEQAGFLYDTTLGYNEAIGFRAGLAGPFRPRDPDRGEPRSLLELPLTAMDGALFRTEKLDAARAVERVRAQLDQVEAVGGLAVLLWHPNAADESRFPGWWAAYRGVLDDIATRSAWVATGREVAEWWAEREGRIAAEEQPAGMGSR